MQNANVFSANCLFCILFFFFYLCFLSHDIHDSQGSRERERWFLTPHYDFHQLAPKLEPWTFGFRLHVANHEVTCMISTILSHNLYNIVSVRLSTKQIRRDMKYHDVSVLSMDSSRLTWIVIQCLISELLSIIV